MTEHLIWNWSANNAPVLILAHGAGAGMDSHFMVTMATRLCERNITVVRFEFPYMQQRRKTGIKRPPDRQQKLLACWHEVIKQVRKKSRSPIFIGGKSMGGRMATLLASEQSDIACISGVICMGYPFYKSKLKDNPRTEHLKTVFVPHVIIQGDRDIMGNYPAVSNYSLSNLISIHWLADGDHDLRPRKSSGLIYDQHLDTAADIISSFISQSLKTQRASTTN